jgi:regulator of RNase E activity RraB
MPAPWQPEFDFYLTRIGDAPVSFVLDMAAAGHAPLESHTLRFEVRVRMRVARADGLRDGSEVDVLGEIEDRVVSRLEERLDAIYAGRFVAKGHTTFVLYLPTKSERALANLEAIVGPTADYVLESRTELDPEWRLYFEFLYPDPYSRQFMQNRRLCEVIAEHGDKTDVARVIDHLALFSTAESAERAKAGLSLAGFDVQAPELVIDEDGQPRKPEAWSLEFRRSDTVDQQRADEFCAEILDLILPEGGSYDGWGAPLVTAAS